jgi:hypothetical protein
MRKNMMVLLAVIASACMGYYYLAFFIPRVAEAHAATHLAGGFDFGHDFYPIWLTSHPGSDRGPYDEQTTREIQRGLFGRPLGLPSDPPDDYRAFAYPAFTNLIFWPTALLPFTTARIVMAILLAAFTVVSVFLWANVVSWRPGILVLGLVGLLTLCSYPVLEGLYADQLGLFVGFLIAASIYALRRDWPLLAGALMALAMIKPQMVILAAIYLIVWSADRWRERKDFLISFITSGIVLALAALAVWPHWIESWATAVLRYHHYADGPLITEILGVSGTLPVATVAVIVTVAVSWKGRKEEVSSTGFCLTLSLLLCLTAVTLLPSQGFQDHVILLPAIFLIWSRKKEFLVDAVGKFLLKITLVMLFWPWVTAFGIVAVHSLLTSQMFYSKAVFVLPARTAAAFPFALLGLLTLAFRRSTVATDKLPPGTTAATGAATYCE